MKIAFYTLGCKVNQFETQALELIFSQNGHEITEFQKHADAYVVNTCTVTAVSDKKSRQIIRKTAREHPNALIAVCGCFAQTNPEAASALGCVDVIAGTGDKAGFVGMIEEALADKRQKIAVDHALSRRDYEVLPAGGLQGHTRAMLKVQDGCVNFCSYCIIPYARGPVRSMKLEEAVLQAKTLAERGFMEIVITGIEISSYGMDFKPRRTITELIAAICEAVPTVRIRLGSLEPRTVDEEFCKVLSSYKNLCPQFHLSLQSGCDATLARMKRKYNTKRYLESVTLLRKSFSDCAITTDLIVGFPGEDDREFSETLSFIGKCAFASMHIFPYSKRENTPAAAMEGQVPRALKEARAKEAGIYAKKMKKTYLESCVGKNLTVLFEEKQDGIWQGHGMNYMMVCASDTRDLKNRVCKVKILKTDGDRLYGDITLLITS